MSMAGAANAADTTDKQYHLKLLKDSIKSDDANEIGMAPVFTEPVRQLASSLNIPLPQYGLLGGEASDMTNGNNPSNDPRLFFNVAAPSSVFICGSQGSGKSHTLACLLENSLIPSRASTLPHPLTGLVFHYDTFISDTSTSPCEAAFLASSQHVHLKVLCSPANIATMRRIYGKLKTPYGGSITVEALKIKESDLDTKRMFDLMALGSDNMPLYMHVISRILREMRIAQQETGRPFDYAHFKRLVEAETFDRGQAGPLKQRLDTLEGFMQKVPTAPSMYPMLNGRCNGRLVSAAVVGNIGTNWKAKAGQLTIVDLSCPCVTPEMACSLFNICLSLFLEQDPSIGRVVALDEAHKYMNESPDSKTLTKSLLSTIRLQRHLGTRVIISTQEPTVSPALLDLCSVTIVHRFTSPSWLRVLREHLAGVSSASLFLKKIENRPGGGKEKDGLVSSFATLSLDSKDPALEVFANIVQLRVGEALLFSPSAIIGAREELGREKKAKVMRLAHRVLKIRVRARITADGGRSIMAE